VIVDTFSAHFRGGGRQGSDGRLYDPARSYGPKI
jgi:hypothetical protein